MYLFTQSYQLLTFLFHLLFRHLSLFMCICTLRFLDYSRVKLELYALLSLSTLEVFSKKKAIFLHSLGTVIKLGDLSLIKDYQVMQTFNP